MKKAITIFILLLIASFVFAQSNPADKNFTFNLGGKQFHTGDTLTSENLRPIFNSPVTIINTITGKSIKLNSYQAVISIKDSNTIWKLDNKLNYNAVSRFRALLTKAKPNDIVFIDELAYAEKPTGYLPKEFAFYIK